MTRKRTTLADAPDQPPEMKRRYLTMDEWKKVVSVLRQRPLRDQTLFFLVYETGMRRSEPGVMRASYLQKLKHNKVYVFRGKHSDQCYVDITPETADLLRLWVRQLEPQPLPRDAHIFPGYRGAGISGELVYKLWSAIAEDAGLPEGRRFPHMLKHSRCQHLLEMASVAGENPMAMVQTIAQLVGHKKAITTIQNYMQQTSREKQFVLDATRKLVR